MIDITQLTDRDIGRRVRVFHLSDNIGCEGEIVAWDDDRVFVQLGGIFKDPEPFWPNDIVFLEEP